VALPRLDDAQVAEVLGRVTQKLFRWLAAHPPPDEDTPETVEVAPMLQLALAAVPQAVAKTEPPADAREKLRRSGPQRTPLCAQGSGFTLHARTRGARHRRGDLEVLCRYILRPALADQKVRWRDDGRVEWQLGRTWSDGTRSLLFEPLAFLARLAPRNKKPPPRGSKLLRRVGHKRIPKADTDATAKRIEQAAKPLTTAVAALSAPAAELELLGRVLTALARTLRLELIGLKQGWKAAGFSEAEIHAVIPDRPSRPGSALEPPPSA
jgi:hypothetical protein